MWHLLQRGSVLRYPVPSLELTATVANSDPFTLGSFPVGSAVDRFFVDWGDGSVTSGDINPSHSYASAGAYDIKMYGLRVATIMGFTSPVVGGDLADFAGLPNLAGLSVDSSISGTLADVAAIPELTSFTFGGGTLTGDLSDLSARTDITILNLAGSSVLTGDLSDLAGLTGMLVLALGASGAGSTAITGDLSVAAGFPVLQTLALEGLAIDDYSGGSFSPAMTLMNVALCDLGATALGALVTTLHTDRVAHGAMGMAFFAYGNPGSASVASSHAAEISAMISAGMTVVVN